MAPSLRYVAILRASSRLASRFAVQAGGQLLGNSYVLSVDNLRAQSDYLQLIEYLENFKGFSQIQIFCHFLSKQIFFLNKK